jgi:membrane protease YdiL (CAAX protease family)
MDEPRDTKTIARLSAFAETALLLIGGSLVARALAKALSLGNRDERDALLYGPDGPDWLAAAGVEAQWLLLRFGLTLLIAWLICWWIGGPSLRLAGVTRGERSWADLIGFGTVMGVLLAAPPFAGRVLNEIYGLGENTRFWDLMARHPWTVEFWIYMAISSFLLVPIVEELFFRAYQLGRFRMHFSAGGAVLLSAAFFWVSHGQYLRDDPYLLANSAMVFVSACIMAWSVVRTGSIAPAMIAHVIFNIPMSTPLRLSVVALALALIVLLFRKLHTAASDFFRTLASTREWLFLIGVTLLLTGGAFLARAYEQALIPLVAVFAVIVVWGLIRRAPWARRAGRART